MPKYNPRPLPPKEEAQLREVGHSVADMASRLDYLAMMADVDLEALNETDDSTEVDDGTQQEI